MRKFFSGILIAAMLLTSAALGACAPSTTGGEKVDPTKTQLYVQNFEGGYKSDWLYAVKQRFEASYAETSFETGKKGVQVMISKAKVDGISLKTSLSTSVSEVFFNESVYYYDYLASDLLLDISDAVTGSLTEFGDTGSVEDKMTDEQISYYKTEDKYYGIPHYAGYNGIVYDRDLFDDYLLYFKDTTGGALAFVASASEKRSAGPDGESGTSDDGYPATYDEFYKLCDYMVQLGITPFVWAGQYYNTYIEKIINALCIDHEGLEQTMLNFTFKGKATNLITPVKSDKSYSYKYGEGGQTIAPSNGYELWTSEGKYQSLSFFEKIVKNSDYYTNLCFSPSHLYTDAQKDFLESTPKGKPIAMILEGCWWENEAKDSIRQVADRYGNQYAGENRNFGMMPLPKANAEKVGEKSTIVDTHYSLGFIKKSIAPGKVDLAKKFLMFCNTEQSLSEFTTITNTVKSLQYSLTDAQYGKLTSYGKSVYDLHKASDIVYPFSAEPIYLDNQSLLSVHNSYGSIIGTQEELHPITYFRSRQSNNAQDYFNGMLKYNQTRWDRVFGGY